MARIEGLIRFPDGEIKVFMYCNTANVVFSQFYDTIKEFEAGTELFHNNNSLFFLEEIQCNHNSERVELYLVDYSLYWVGSACRNCKTILTGLDPASNIILEDSSGDSYYDSGDEGAPIKISPPEWCSKYLNNEVSYHD